jgi:hypothetical protein
MPSVPKSLFISSYQHSAISGQQSPISSLVLFLADG